MAYRSRPAPVGSPTLSDTLRSVRDRNISRPFQVDGERIDIGMVRPSLAASPAGSRWNAVQAVPGSRIQPIFDFNGNSGPVSDVPILDSKAFRVCKVNAVQRTCRAGVAHLEARLTLSNRAHIGDIALLNAAIVLHGLRDNK